MKKITFLPRALAAQYRPAPNFVLISIHDKSEPELSPQAGWGAVLYQRFHDTDGQCMGLELFTPDHANAILTFTDQHSQCDELVVHCQMGQSRSAAVALYLSEKYNVPCYKVGTRVDWSSIKMYNRLVYRVLHRVDTQPEIYNL